MSVDLINHVFRSLEKHFPSATPRDPQQPRNRASFAPVEGSSPNAGIGTADASASPIRFWTVRFERGGHSHYDRVEAPDLSTAAIVTLARNVGSVCAEPVCEITRAEYDRFTRRSP
jgi:hypothetical protein